MALIKCLECGKEISDKATACPHCGCPLYEMVDVKFSPSASANSTATENKPKKKMKLWLLISAVVLVVAIVTIISSSLPSKFKWNEVILNSVLPEPVSAYGSLYMNDADDLYLTVRKVPFSEYKAYVDSCVNNGFTYIVESSASSYTAFNSDGCELELDYHEYNEAMDISLDVRISGTIKWSNSKLASLLPVPKSNIGRIINDYNYGYEVYIGNTSKAEYDTYISMCEEKGFNLNIQKTDSTFYAENELGYELIVEYYECDLIYIDIDVPEDTSDTEKNSDEEAKSEKIRQTNSEITEKENSGENTSPSKSVTIRKVKSVVEELLEKDLDQSVKISKLYFNEEKQGCYVEFKANNLMDAAAVHLDTGEIDYKSEFDYYSKEAEKLRAQTPINEQELHKCNQKILNSSYAEWSFSITVIENDKDASKNGWKKIQ